MLLCASYATMGVCTWGSLPSCRGFCRAVKSAKNPPEHFQRRLLPEGAAKGTKRANQRPVASLASLANVGSGSSHISHIFALRHVARTIHIQQRCFQAPVEAIERRAGSR